MKKLTMLLLAAALTLCPLFALAAQETISVYNWGDYIEPEVLDLFEQETGIKVIYETFETNEDMYAKIAMGGSSYDVIIPSDYMIERMIQENLLQKINWENIPNVANIDPRFMNEGYDPQSEYAVPYTWGTMGILYNTEMVDEAPTSWNTLMDPAYTMDMLMLNSPRDTLAIALVMTGHDLNSTDPADLEDAKNLLIEQKPMVLAYVVDEVKDKMIAGEAAVAMVWSGDATFCMSENDELDYVVPEEGSNIFYDSICIPANARNVSGAEKFIDFLCRGDIAAMNYEYVGYAIPNTAAIDIIGADEYNASPVNNPSQEALDHCEVFKYLGAKTIYRTVDEIKKSGTINIGVFSDKAPFGYVDENGEYQGYDIYFAERLGKDLGVKINYVSTEAANRIEYLQTGKVDVILANFTVTDERAEEVDFALPYMNVSLGVVSGWCG